MTDARPSCPACGDPLYGWLETPASTGGAGAELLQRCETCGLGIVAGTTGEAAVASIGEGTAAPGAGTAELRVANRRSLQASLGGRHWAALEPPGRALYLTPDSLRRLAARAGLEVVDLRCPRWGRPQRWMWQTIVNSFTFHDNFAREVRAGRLRPRTGRGRIAFAIDALVTTLASPVVALISVPLELGGALALRGGELVATLRATRSGA